MKINVNTSWKEVIINQTKLKYWNKLEEQVDLAYSNFVCYPKYENIFKCFDYFDFKDTNVVIIGQDPYHIPDMANGLAFASDNTKLPMSLKNIYKEGVKAEKLWKIVCFVRFWKEKSPRKGTTKTNVLSL